VFVFLLFLLLPDFLVNKDIHYCNNREEKGHSSYPPTPLNASIHIFMQWRTMLQFNICQIVNVIVPDKKI